MAANRPPLTISMCVRKPNDEDTQPKETAARVGERLMGQRASRCITESVRFRPQEFIQRCHVRRTVCMQAFRPVFLSA
jgi:hypothetical protein